jgi:P pilus assembly chaperone PapD
MKRIKIFWLILAFLAIAAIAFAATYATVSVSGTPVHIYTATSAATTIGIVIQNDPGSAVTVYVGSDGAVNATNHGYSLSPGMGIILNGHSNDWYAVTAGSAANVNYQLLF